LLGYAADSALTFAAGALAGPDVLPAGYTIISPEGSASTCSSLVSAPALGAARGKRALLLEPECAGKPSNVEALFMEARPEGVEPLDRAMICRL
jgi:hypothetical protein